MHGKIFKTNLFCDSNFIAINMYIYLQILIDVMFSLTGDSEVLTQLMSHVADQFNKYDILSYVFY